MDTVLLKRNDEIWWKNVKKRDLRHDVIASDLASHFKELVQVSFEGEWNGNIKIMTTHSPCPWLRKRKRERVTEP